MGRKIKAKANMNKSKQREYKSPDTTWIFPKEPPPRKCMEVKTRTATINFFSRYFHSAHPTGWAESISGNGVCVSVCMSVITSMMLY